LPEPKSMKVVSSYVSPSPRRTSAKLTGEVGTYAEPWTQLASLTSSSVCEISPPVETP
jgi:hypothetical protein